MSVIPNFPNFRRLAQKRNTFNKLKYKTIKQLTFRIQGMGGKGLPLK